MCIKGSPFIPDAERVMNPNLGLSLTDIEVIVDRFEVAERVDWHVFLAFFDERETNKTSLSYATSPFQLSSEWAALKRDAKIVIEEPARELISGERAVLLIYPTFERSY